MIPFASTTPFFVLSSEIISQDTLELFLMLIISGFIVGLLYGLLRRWRIW